MNNYASVYVFYRIAVIALTLKTLSLFILTVSTRFNIVFHQLAESVFLKRVFYSRLFFCSSLSSVTAVRLPDGLSFVVYEFWDGEEEWKR